MKVHERLPLPSCCHPTEEPVHADPRFPVPSLTIRAWPDAVIDEIGHDPRSGYVERFWLSLLGPSATWLLRRLADGLDERPDGFELDLALTAVSLGLGRRGGKSGPFMRTIERCCYFGVAQRCEPTTLRVRRKLPPLTRVQLARLPEPLQAEHDEHLARAGAPTPDVAQLRAHARRLARSLLDLGEDATAAERQLHRWRVHPALAREAVEWALTQSPAAPSATAAPTPPAATEPGTDRPLLGLTGPVA
jgi:hypothetical protein